jgi:hypothetical protein
MSRGRFLLWSSAVVVGALLVSTMAVHVDINFIAFASHWVSWGSLNVYQAVWEHPAARGHIGGLTYPPLTYLFFGAVIAFFKVFGLFAYPEWYGPRRLTGAEYLALRLTLTPFVLLVAWTTRRFYERFLRPEGEHGRLAFLVALCSPVLLFVTYVFGQFDVMPAALLLLGVYLLSIQRPFWGVLAVFGGIWLKNFPLVFLVLAMPVLIAQVGLKRAAAAVAIPTALTIGLVRAFKSRGFTEGYLAFRHHDYDVLVFKWSDVNATGTIYVLGALVLLSVWFALRDTPPSERWREYLVLYACSLAAVLGTRIWMPQYIAWIAPAAALAVIWSAEQRNVMILLAYLAFMGVYLVTPMLLFPGNVDGAMFHAVYQQGIPSLTDKWRLHGLKGHAWTTISLFLFLTGGFYVVRTLWPAALERMSAGLRYRWPEGLQLRAAAVGSVAVFAGYVVFQVGSVLLMRMGR